MPKFSIQPPGSKRDATEQAVDPAALNAFAAGARERRGAEEEPPPWEPFDPKAKPRHNVSLRLNDYHLVMLQYLSTSLDMSQHKILSRQLTPALQRMALEAFESRQNRTD